MENLGTVEADSSDEEKTESPPMTHEEREWEKSRTFVLALQELRTLRPQLYQAADYCEHQYLFGDNKQGVLDHLKDYSVKALVNAVDHLGTVAYKLNDLIAQQHEEIDAAQLAASAVAQRLRACQEHSDREGLKQQSMAKTMHVNHKHYSVPDDADPPPKKAGQRITKLLRESFDLSQPIPPIRMHISEAESPEPQDPPNNPSELPELEELAGPRTWYFDSEFSPTARTAPDRLLSTSASKQRPHPSILSSTNSFLNRTSNPSFSRASTMAPRLSVSPTNTEGSATNMPGHATAALGKPSTTRSGSVPPSRRGPAKTGNLDLEKTMFLTPAPPEEPKNSRGKGILRSLLGRKS